MDVTLVAPPNDSMWWVLRPEFIGFVDKVVIDRNQWVREDAERNKSGYHKLVWERLSVLGDEGILVLDDLDLPSIQIEQKANTLIEKALSDRPEVFVDDLISAYEYWISFNRLKLHLLPKGQQYSKLISDLVPVWESDLAQLKTDRSLALIDQPKIVEYVAKNIFIKVIELEELNRIYHKCAFSSLSGHSKIISHS